MKAHTALEALYPEVQKRYNAARYGNYNGLTGIQVLKDDEPSVFISDEGFDKWVKLNPGKKADELLFDWIDNINGDEEEINRIIEARKSNPTGIANPADYMSSIKVTKTKEDTDGDGDVDKVEIEKEEE